MKRLVVRAYLQLVLADAYIAMRSFRRLYDRVRQFQVHDAKPLEYSCEELCAAIDIASIWYWKQALCLQRSAATTCLLRTYGIPAQLVIGAQRNPFRAHAWVEVEGQIVNDKPYLTDIYSVLDRC
jgi:hypothetical protein